MNLSVREAAQLLSVSEKTIYRWIKQGTLPAYKISESYRFNRAELLDWATSQRIGVTVDAFSEPESRDLPLPTLSEALKTGGIYYRIEGQSREEVLASAADHLRLPEEVDRHHVRRLLINRELFASTASGDGIAIPRPHSPALLNLARSNVTLCFLENPVDFHALDGRPVAMLLIILAANLRAHLHLLSLLGFVLQDQPFRRVLDRRESREQIFAALKASEARIKV
jgi:PTS system nitrogen regulatory IIA component